MKISRRKFVAAASGLLVPAAYAGPLQTFGPKLFTASGGGSGDNSALAVACRALDEGDSATFTNSGFTNFGENNANALSWQTSWHHDDVNGYLHIMGKAANSTDWKHAFYHIATDTWTDSGTALLFSDVGHIYGNFTMDPSTGRCYILQGNFNVEKRPYSCAGNGATTWALLFNAYGGAMESHMNGAAYHPNAFGVGDGALCADMQDAGFLYRTSTGAVTTYSQAAYTGEREGAGVYWPAEDIVVIGGSPVGGTGVLHSIAPNGGAAPIITNLGAPGIPVRGGSHTGSGSNFGSIHVHPNNPAKLVILNTTTTDMVESLDGSSWSAAPDHPFTATPRVVCSLKDDSEGNPLGCFLVVDVTALGVPTLRLWKPAP
jgi:hypothetical protein